MMTNLFSTFDPSTSMSSSMNWMSCMLWMLILPTPLWMTPNRIMMITSMMLNNLHKEFKTLMGESIKGSTMLMISMFMFILMNNSMGLMPYIFTSTSHLSVTLSMALPLWISLMLFGWINKTNHMFSHLIPTGTPTMLMPFMVIIETMSNIIRPGALAVRLTANMIAGHLLMSLMGNSMNEPSSMMPLIMVAQMMLMSFEMAVAVIQAYVFSVLSTLYSSEI
uniref:ATP synthase subunit a n=1 Tax=Phaenacantha marcida TaxID=498930 RepID=B7SMJ6_9HEMI|nr:ATP synthase F0 subunit 6 [Phaenacantha marcida]ABZ02090.1 ATP synthase F0 subunit 6 [Phaenacantha marcida]